AGTVLVKDIGPSGARGLYHLTNVNGILYFSGHDGFVPGGHGSELWRSDGTTAGTVLVKDINPGGSSYPSLLTPVNGTLFFRASDGIHGYELWKSDGTTAGTVMLKDINPGSASSYPRGLTNVNGTLYFDATGAIPGDELWKSDGTTAGTTLVT